MDSFEIQDEFMANPDYERIGIRRCMACKEIFHFRKMFDNDLVLFPSSSRVVIVSDFPTEIQILFQEFVKSENVEAYISSAIILRKIVEVFYNKLGSKKKTLFTMIQELYLKTIITENIKKGLEEIKFLGNNAAHWEPKEYKEIGKLQIDTAFDLIYYILDSYFKGSKIAEKISKLKETRSSEKENEC